MGKHKRKKLPRKPSSRWENNIVTDLLKALLGNSSVNMFQHMRQANIRWECFLFISARTVAMERARGDVTQ
jgi:hypothetical protein